ncbi:MAG: hypothetical protein EP338_02715 [Bacteroidetes bacterium]|nr:MAG: hypothetical protein EP338_02715 [Bacteroidota bacterium]
MMKKVRFLYFLPLLTVLSVSCRDKVYRNYKSYQPVYTSVDDFRREAIFEAPRLLRKKGNIYYHERFLFIVEPNEGIHFIDNSNPESPVKTGFLSIVGCSGLAIRGNYMYVSALIDLLVLDISDLQNPKEIKRVEDVFPMALPVKENNYPLESVDRNLGVVTSWKVVEHKEDIEQDQMWIGCANCEVMTLNTSLQKSSGMSVGQAGSIAQMAIVNDYLYAMENSVLNNFDLSNPSDPQEGEELPLSWDVETLFPHEDKLFVGTTSGMMILSTENPAQPTKMGSIRHARACDPVVVQGEYAYVTIRSGGPCSGVSNQLDIIDISDCSSPMLMRSYQLKNPHGLGIDGKLLFVCDGKKGLKVFDATEPENAGDHLIKRFGQIQATDVILLGDVAILIGDDGLYQYDYSDPENIRLLSRIAFV